MKHVLLFFVLISLTTCESIQYDGERRLVFQTIVVDSNGEPLPNSHVEIKTLSGSGYTADIISLGETNENGEITLLFPSPEGDEININLKIYNDDVSYMEKEILNISKSTFVNYKLIYPNVNLLKNEETAPLNLTYNQNTPNNILKKVSINGIYHVPFEYFTFPEDEYYELPAQFLIKKNQTFQLKYTVKNTQTNVETENLVNLQIGTDALNYTLNY